MSDVNELLSKISGYSNELEKVAGIDNKESDMDFEKVAEEYEYAGRIMARGMWDELTKLATGEDTVVPVGTSPYQEGQEQNKVEDLLQATAQLAQQKEQPGASEITEVGVKVKPEEIVEEAMETLVEQGAPITEGTVKAAMVNCLRKRAAEGNAAYGESLEMQEAKADDVQMAAVRKALENAGFLDINPEKVNALLTQLNAK